MSLQPTAIPPVPDETARIAKKVFKRKGNLYLVIGDQIGTLFEKIDFADLYASDGAPAFSPNLLALVAVFQRLEDLSDRAMADAVRARIDLKYALHLPLEHMGFDGSLLSDFRERLLHDAAALRMFDGVLERLTELGLLAAGGKQRSDGTYVLAATRTLTRLELLAESMRLALQALAEYRPDWLRTVAFVHWHERYGKPWNSWRLPRKTEQREQLALEIAADGFHLLQALSAAEAPSQAASLPEVVSLRQVWSQQLVQEADKISWRPREQIPAGAERVTTPHDAQVRGSQHGDHVWEGYAVHFTETSDKDRPHLITDVAVVPSTTPDHQVIEQIYARLTRRNLLPSEHLVDAGYTTGRALVDSSARQVRLVGPLAQDASWQAHLPDGIASDQFKLDWVAQVATCPNGQQSSAWQLNRDSDGQPEVDIRFSKAACQACPLRQGCTRNRAGRRLKLSLYHEAILAARANQRTALFKQEYARRAGIEGTISATVRSQGARRTRYIGLAKTDLQAILTAIAVNLRRTALWLMAERPATTRPPGLTCLAHLAT